MTPRSFLVTEKMNPALAARVATSLSGKRVRASHKPALHRRTSWLRLAAVGCVLFVVFAVVREQRARQAEIDAAKASLLEQRSALQVTLTPRTRRLSERIAAIIEHEASVYHGVVAARGLQTLSDWDRQLSRPLLYARVATENVSPRERLDAALSESRVDTFVSCLRDPPVDDTEKQLMQRVREVFSGGPHEHNTNVFRVWDAVVSVRVLDPEVDLQIVAAKDLQPIVHLKNTWEAARVEERLAAVFGEVLLLLIDEPKLAGTPVELDGASVHGVRVVLVDISGEKDEVVFRSHLDSNPSWVSERRRHQYSNALEGCRLAYLLRSAWTKPDR